MHAFSKFLCVIDPTVAAQPALERAAWLASRAGAELELLVCYYDEFLAGTRLFDSASLKQARAETLEDCERRLERHAEPLRGAGLSVRTKALWVHPLHEGVARHAAAINADIVFKDTHHHSALARALFTNADWNLIRTCAAPLWLVKPGALPEAPVFVAAIDPMHANDKPAALDDQILFMGKELGRITGGEVHAFHSYDPRIAISSTIANAYIPVSLPIEEIDRNMRAQHETRFKELTEFHDLDAARTHLLSGRTHEELPALAARLGASVVIMGAVARNPLRRVFIGASAERTLEHLPCDLLIVKPDWFRSPIELRDKDAA